MDNRRKEKGITLIALVVTVIILIILAGISISLVLGNNGIVTKSKLAKENTLKAKEDEDIALLEYANKINTYITGSTREDNPSYNNYIALKGVTGISSEKKVLDAGVYEINYFGATFTALAGVANGEVYVSDECVFSKQGDKIWESSSGPTIYACSGTTETITIENQSEVYLKIDGGAYFSCGLITINKIQDI